MCSIVTFCILASSLSYSFHPFPDLPVALYLFRLPPLPPGHGALHSAASISIFPFFRCASLALSAVPLFWPHTTHPHYTMVMCTCDRTKCSNADKNILFVPASATTPTSRRTEFRVQHPSYSTESVNCIDSEKGLTAT